jgi:SAM-dependent methyltransferase
MNCPICDRPSQRVFEKHGYWIRECQNCYHRFCEIQASEDHAKSVYDDSYFTEGGAGYSDYLAESRLLIEHGEWYGALLQKYTTPGKMLDVGAAAGFVLRGFTNKGWTGRGVEPNPRMAEYARTTLGLDVQAGTLETFQVNEQFHLVSMVQVIAHFYELRKALQVAADLTEPGGYWLIESWNKDSWMARILGENWHEYSPPSVLHWFSPDTLKRLAALYGFTQVAGGRPSKWLDSGHAKSLVRYKLESSPLGRIGAKAVNLFPDNVSLPYPSFDLFWSLFQKTS